MAEGCSHGNQRWPGVNGFADAGCGSWSRKPEGHAGAGVWTQADAPLGLSCEADVLSCEAGRYMPAAWAVTPLLRQPPQRYHLCYTMSVCAPVCPFITCSWRAWLGWLLVR